MIFCQFADRIFLSLIIADRKAMITMKIKPGYLLREVAGNYIIVAIGEEAVDFNGLITVNETGAFLWKKLESGVDTDELLTALRAEYDVPEEIAIADINGFIEKLQKADLLVK